MTQQINKELMKMHVGTKVIRALPMNRQDYNDFRGWQLPEDENGADEGMLVEYLDGGKPNTDQFEGYVSWSPKEVFENAYLPNGGLDFGAALMLMHNGMLMTRKGWNGRREGGLPMTVNIATALNMSKPFFTMVHADESVGIWTPVTNDVLAMDWEIVEPMESNKESEKQPA